MLLEVMQFFRGNWSRFFLFRYHSWYCLNADWFHINSLFQLFRVFGVVEDVAECHKQYFNFIFDIFFHILKIKVAQKFIFIWPIWAAFRLILFFFHIHTFDLLNFHIYFFLLHRKIEIDAQFPTALKCLVVYFVFRVELGKSWDLIVFRRVIDDSVAFCRCRCN